jgi:altronate dehydratase
MKRVILMNAKDNVATALENIDAGDPTGVALPSQELLKEVTPKQAIPFGHKLAIANIEKGGRVIKYGELIGNASQKIRVGEHVHTHNVRSNRMQMPEVWYREEG